MDQPRPKSPNVLGILSIVFGAITLAFSLLGLVSPGMSRSMYSAADMPALEAYLDAIQPASSVVIGVVIALSLALIFIGIGQRRYRRWARSAAVIWGWIALLVLVGMTVHQVAVVGPALQTLFKSVALIREHPQVTGLASSMGFISLFFYAPYPIILIVLMGKRRVVDAMTS